MAKQFDRLPYPSFLKATTILPSGLDEDVASVSIPTGRAVRLAEAQIILTSTGQ